MFDAGKYDRTISASAEYRATAW